MKKTALVIFFLLPFLIKAQDTIYKRNGDVIPAKIIEINTAEISYNRSDMVDGPLFIIEKNDVKKLKYKTGAIDSFTVYQKKPLTQNYRLPAVIAVTYNEQMQKALRKGTYLYHGETISDWKVLDIASDKNAVWKNTQLESEIENVKKNRQRQYISSLGGLGIGLFTMAGTIVYSINNPSDQTAPPVIFFAGLGLILTSQIVSIHFKIQRIRHSDNAVAIYNQKL